MGKYLHCQLSFLSRLSPLLYEISLYMPPCLILVMSVCVFRSLQVTKKLQRIDSRQIYVLDVMLLSIISALVWPVLRCSLRPSIQARCLWSLVADQKWQVVCYCDDSALRNTKSATQKQCIKQIFFECSDSWFRRSRQFKKKQRFHSFSSLSGAKGLRSSLPKLSLSSRLLLESFDWLVHLRYFYVVYIKGGFFKIGVTRKFNHNSSYKLLDSLVVTFMLRLVSKPCKSRGSK